MKYEYPNLDLSDFVIEQQRQTDLQRAKAKESLVINTAKCLCKLEGKDPEALIEFPLASSSETQARPETVQIPLYRSYLSKAEALCDIFSESFYLERRVLYTQLHEEFGF